MVEVEFHNLCPITGPKASDLKFCKLHENPPISLHKQVNGVGGLGEGSTTCLLLNTVFVTNFGILKTVIFALRISNKLVS